MRRHSQPDQAQRAYTDILARIQWCLDNGVIAMPATKQPVKAAVNGKKREKKVPTALQTR